VLRIARDHPELSPRLLAVKITDEQSFSVSESTVYRILKDHGLIEPRALEDMPASKQWKHQTMAPCMSSGFFGEMGYKTSWHFQVELDQFSFRFLFLSISF